MNKQLDARCIRREMCEHFKGEKIRVRITPTGFELIINNSNLNRRKVMCVVENWYRAAYGATVRWGHIRTREME